VRYRRMPIEVESPENLGYDRIRVNLTESSFTDTRLSELLAGFGDTRAEPAFADLVLEYAHHAGRGDVRELLAADVPNAAAGDVLLTAGAASALFIVATSLLDPGDHIVVARPNYGTNIETPRAIGCDIAFLDLSFDERWTVDPARIAALMTPRTKLVSLTCPHNPTGAVMPEETLREIVALVEERGCRLLVDETYREMTYGPMLPPAASLSTRAISVSSLSKTYGLPGLRMGWLVTRDRELMETFLAAKEQIAITNSVVDEALALRAIRMRPSWLPEIRARIAAALEVTRDWMATQDELEWVEPGGGVACFPRFRPDVKVDLDRFYRLLNEDYGAYVGPGHWFEQPRRHMRIGFGWPTLEQLRDGLGCISRAARGAREA
jgi:aspartate/methionine/tyrosine aminotransferase